MFLRAFLLCGSKKATRGPDYPETTKVRREAGITETASDKHKPNNIDQENY
jgi:hypothetical protein